MCITKTLAKVRKFEAGFGRDLEEAFLVELGCSAFHVRTLARMGEIRFAGSVK